MSLDPAYLAYPKRRRGMDHDLYAWSNLFERSPVTWSGVKIWIVVNLEWFPIIPVDAPFRAPGHMQTPYPDFRHYTAREYGTRVGVYRLLDAFSAVGLRASFATNAAIAVRYPELIRDIVAAGHEIIAHSTDMNGTIATGLTEDAEYALIESALDQIESATGNRPRGWLSIAQSQSWNTPHLLARAGLDYMCDWVNDDLPCVFSTLAGSIINIPLNHELSDRQILNVQQQSIDSYAEQITDAAVWLEGETSRFGGRLLPLAVTPYIIGLPYRIDVFVGLLACLKARPSCSFVTGSELI